MFKAIGTCALVCAVASNHVGGDIDDMKVCMSEQCNDLYTQCQKKSGCEAKIEKCADKCGIKVNQLCWGSCIGLLSGPPYLDLLTCAANHCMDKSESEINFEQIGKMIDEFIKSE